MTLKLAEKIAESFRFFVTEMLKAKPTTQQDYFIDAVQKAIDNKASKYITIKSGHGTGKTACLAWLILWIGLTRKEAKIPTTAPVASQLANLLIPEVSKWNKRLPSEMQDFAEVQSQDVKFFNGNHCFARTARKDNTEALAGVHSRFVCYVVDEASGIDQKIFDVIEGALTEENFIFVMASNPTRTTGTFFASHNLKRKHYQALTFNSEESENVSQTWIDTMREKYGENSDIYRIRVLGKFPKQATSGLFTSDKIDEAMDGNYNASLKNGVRIIAQDVARFGDDSNVFARRQGLVVTEIKEKIGDVRTTEVVSMVAYQYNKENADACFIDVTGGLGAGPLDTLISIGVPAMEANYTALADNPIYANKRAEMYFNLKEAIDNGAKLPNDESLREELLATTYKFTTKGQIIIVPKADIKVEIGRSPDKADAVAMLFFAKIPPKGFTNITEDWRGGW